MSGKSDRVRKEASVGATNGESYLEVMLVDMTQFDVLQDRALDGDKKSILAAGTLVNVFAKKKAGKFGNFLCLICLNEIVDDPPPLMCMVMALEGATVADISGICDCCVDNFETEDALKSGIFKALGNGRFGGLRELSVSASSGRA